MAKPYFKDHPVQSGLVVGIILLFISSTGIVAWLQNIAWWTAIKNVISTIWNAVVWFMTINFPIWGILLFIVIVVAILYISNLIYNATHSPLSNEQMTLDWLKYTSDTFGQFKYEWKYVRSNNKCYAIDDITVICPNCGTTLLSEDTYHSSYRCPRCDKYYGHIFNNAPKSLRDVEALIVDNIKRKKYNN